MAEGRQDQSSFLRGPFPWVALGVLIGAVLGIGFFTFGFARGSSYITDRADACANCHIMQDQYQSWMKSSHRAAAVCNDCHTPAGLIPKYGTKMLNGFFHSLAFTTGEFPDQIRITGRNLRVAENACMKCHATIVHGIQGIRSGDSPVRCIQCHSQVGHQ
jgi:cytochrome c nitrite reductase small subunit